MSCFRRVHTGEADVNLSMRSAQETDLAGVNGTYCVTLQISLLLWDFSSWEPSPTSQSAAGRMEKMEIVCIANSGNCAKQASLPKEAWHYMGSFWNSPEVGSVEADRHQDCCGEKNGRDQRPWVRVLRPIGGIETVFPRDRPFLIIVVPLGIWRPWWPSHCVERCKECGEQCDEARGSLVFEKLMTWVRWWRPHQG